jgi:Spx/MgsR family transcriptional regulator
MIQIYGIKNCDSVKKALKFFKEHHVEYTLHDFKLEPATCEKVSSWLTYIQLKELFNAKSTTYRTLKLKDKNLNEQEQIDFLCQENLLIKRPVIEFGDKIIIGFNEENYKGVFL